MAGDRRRALLGALVAALLLAGCDAPSTPGPAFAYDPTEATGGLIYHWEIGKTIAVYADPTDQPEGFDIREAVRQAAALWEETTYFREYAFRLVDTPREADVVVHYRTAPRVVDVMDCEPPGSGDGKTVFCADIPEAAVLPLLDGGGGRVKVDVYVDPLGVAEPIIQQAGVTRREYLTILTAHELGHVLGIGAHSNAVEDIMRSVPVAPRPSAADAATLRWVLSQPPDIRL